MLWEELKVKISLWIRAASVCVQIAFTREKQLIEEIIGGLGTAASDECFLVHDVATQLSL